MRKIIRWLAIGILSIFSICLILLIPKVWNYFEYSSYHKTPAGFFRATGLELPSEAQIIGHQLDSYWSLADTPSHTWLIRLTKDWQQKLLSAGKFRSTEIDDTPGGRILWVEDVISVGDLFKGSENVLQDLRITDVYRNDREYVYGTNIPDLFVYHIFQFNSDRARCQGLSTFEAGNATYQMTVCP